MWGKVDNTAYRADSPHFGSSAAKGGNLGTRGSSSEALGRVCSFRRRLEALRLA